MSKSNFAKSVLGNRSGFLNGNELRKANFDRIAKQFSGIDILGLGINTSAMSRVDSVYSSNNVPVIKDLKPSVRPMSMKQPNRLRQKIDQQPLKDDKSQHLHNPSLHTAWASKNFSQVPFSSSNFQLDSSVGVQPDVVRSPQYSMSKKSLSKNMSRFGNNFKELSGIHSPTAALDLSKPVLSLRNQSKEEIDFSEKSSMIEHYQRMVRQKMDYQNKIEKVNARKVKSSFHIKDRIDSAARSVKSHAVSSRKIKHRRTLNKDLPLKASYIQNEFNRGIRSSSGNYPPISIEKIAANHTSTQLARITEKRASLRIRRNVKKARVAKRHRSGNQSENVDLSGSRMSKSQANKSLEKHSSKRKKRKSKGKSKSKSGASSRSPLRQYSRTRDKLKDDPAHIMNSPGASDAGGIFGLSMNDESLPDLNTAGINIKSSQANFNLANDKNRIEVIDWAKSDIFQMVLDGDITLNRDK